MLAGYHGERIVAGAIANRSSTVVGCAATAAALWGEMPTVGYDSGDLLDAAHRGGFNSIGELVVWLNAPSGVAVEHLLRAQSPGPVPPQARRIANWSR